MKKILLADDSAFMRKLLRGVLSDGGYEYIVEAENGEEAVSVYNREKPDLVLLDIIMEKKDGLQVLKEIREINPEAKVIMVTAIGQEYLMKKAMRLGAKGFVVKPFKDEKILELVKKFSDSEE